MCRRGFASSEPSVLLLVNELVLCVLLKHPLTTGLFIDSRSDPPAFFSTSIAGAQTHTGTHLAANSQEECLYSIYFLSSFCYFPFLCRIAVHMFIAGVAMAPARDCALGVLLFWRGAGGGFLGERVELVWTCCHLSFDWTICFNFSSTQRHLVN